MRILTIFTLGACAWAQTGVDRPQLGKMLDGNGALRTVYGIAASVTLGDAETTGVISSGCSDKLCLAKMETSIVSADGSSVDAPPGAAMFAFDGNAAYIWFPQSRQLARWHDGVLDSLYSKIEGEILSIGLNAGSLQFAVRRSKQNVWIVNPDGSAAGSIAHSTGPVMLIPGGVVYAARGEVVIGNARFPLEGVTTFSQMSTNYLQIRAGGADYSLRIEAGRETLFQLPGVSQ